MVCKKCGTENFESAKFCRECGTAFITTRNKERQKAISKKVWVDIIIIAVMCGAVFLAAFLYQHRDELYIKILDNSIAEELKPDYIKVAEKYVRAEARNDIDGIVELLPLEPLGTWGNLLKQYILAEYEEDSERKYEIVDRDIIYKVMSVKDSVDDEFTDLQNQYREDWDIAISDAKTIKMKFRYVNSTEEHIINVFLVEIQENWYLDLENIDNW